MAAFCKLLELARDMAPSPEAATAVQEVINAHCSNVTAQDGGTPPPPPTPGGGTGNGPPGGGG